MNNVHPVTRKHFAFFSRDPFADLPVFEDASQSLPTNQDVALKFVIDQNNHDLAYFMTNRELYKTTRLTRGGPWQLVLSENQVAEKIQNMIDNSGRKLYDLMDLQIFPGGRVFVLISAQYVPGGYPNDKQSYLFRSYDAASTWNRSREIGGTDHSTVNASGWATSLAYCPSTNLFYVTAGKYSSAIYSLFVSYDGGKYFEDLGRDLSAISNTTKWRVKAIPSNQGCNIYLTSASSNTPPYLPSQIAISNKDGTEVRFGSSTVREGEEVTDIFRMPDNSEILVNSRTNSYIPRGYYRSSDRFATAEFVELAPGGNPAQTLAWGGALNINLSAPSKALIYPNLHNQYDGCNSQFSMFRTTLGISDTANLLAVPGYCDFVNQLLGTQRMSDIHALAIVQGKAYVGQ